MKRKVLILLLVLGIGLVSISLLKALPGYRLPGNHEGYRPTQPLEYSHRVHAGDLAIPCLYCHSGAERSRHAGIPSANVCMNCHKFVTATLGAVREEEERAEEEGREVMPVESVELRKFYDALGLDDQLAPDPEKEPQPIIWKRVHQLPDFVYFDHRPHVAKNVECQTCHGPVETMERVRQFSSLSMGWCVDCHRQSGIPQEPAVPVESFLDCTTCHF